jgi:hypothetical protein
MVAQTTTASDFTLTLTVAKKTHYEVLRAGVGLMKFPQ